MFFILYNLEIIKKYPDLKTPEDLKIDPIQLKIFADIEAEFNQTKPRKRSPSPSGSDTASKKMRNQPESETSQERKKSSIELKLEAAAPYNFLLSKVKDSPVTQKALDSVFLADLLHPSLGRLVSSLQINFMVDLDFLMMNYEVTRTENLPLVLLYGHDSPELSSPHLSETYPNLRAIRIRPKSPFGTHHSKMMVLLYEDGGVRVVVHTANLIPSDWENRTQGDVVNIKTVNSGPSLPGLWVSEKCPASPSADSRTGFKCSLLRYLQHYEVSAVQQFITAIQRSDMSGINTAFISSVPGSHKVDSRASF